MTAFEWIVGGGILAIIGFVLTAGKYGDDKITRVYQRLDQTKKYQDDTFTRREICNVLHEQLRNDITEIKTDIKVLLKQHSQHRGGE